jgi:hypothetical protein
MSSAQAIVMTVAPSMPPRSTAAISTGRLVVSAEARKPKP